MAIQTIIVVYGSRRYHPARRSLTRTLPSRFAPCVSGRDEGRCLGRGGAYRAKFPVMLSYSLSMRPPSSKPEYVLSVMLLDAIDWPVVEYAIDMHVGSFIMKRNGEREGGARIGGRSPVVLVGV